MRLVFSTLVFLTLNGYMAQSATNVSAKDVVNGMLKSIQAHQGAEYLMRSHERLVGKSELKVSDLFTKMTVSPNRIYVKVMSDPNKGTEMLFVKGERENKILLNAGKFLPNMKMNMTNALITKDQHHILHRTGFKTVSDLITTGVKRAEKENGFDKAFKVEGEVVYQSKNCYKLVIEDPTSNIVTYKAQPGEKLDDVSKKLQVPEYAIMELNAVKSFETDLGNKVLKVPTSYAKKTVMYVEKETMFPIYQEMSDDKGVFEKYEFFNLKINPAFKADEFTEKFSGYSF